MSNLLREQIGGNIKQARLKRGLSQEELAREIGVTTRNLQRWEKGVVTPYYRNIQAVAAALDVDEEDLLGMVPQKAGDNDSRHALQQRDMAEMQAQIGELIAFKRDIKAEVAKMQKQLEVLALPDLPA